MNRWSVEDPISVKTCFLTSGRSDSGEVSPWSQRITFFWSENSVKSKGILSTQKSEVRDSLQSYKREVRSRRSKRMLITSFHSTFDRYPSLHTTSCTVLSVHGIHQWHRTSRSQNHPLVIDQHLIYFVTNLLLYWLLSYPLRISSMIHISR